MEILLLVIILLALFLIYVKDKNIINKSSFFSYMKSKIMDSIIFGVIFSIIMYFVSDDKEIYISIAVAVFATLTYLLVRIMAYAIGKFFVKHNNIYKK